MGLITDVLLIFNAVEEEENEKVEEEAPKDETEIKVDRGRIFCLIVGSSL